MASNSRDNLRASTEKQITTASFLLKGLLIILFVGVALYLEWPRERQSAHNKCDLFERTDNETPGESYAKTVAAGFHSVRSRRVTIIPFNAQTAPSKILKNICEQRYYLARLIQSLSASGAAAIVIDKFFDPESCDQNDPRTADLVHAIQISSLPIVIGAATHVPENDPKHACLILSNSLEFGKKLDAKGNATERPAVILGLTRLNVDLRRIPLKWYVYPDDQAFNDRKDPNDGHIGTLSYTAASIVDKGLGNEAGLSELRKADIHPFTSFIAPNEMAIVRPSSLLCSSADKADIQSRYSLDCSREMPVENSLAGQVVLIGQDSTSDQHFLFGQQLSGFYLQANYIESLLDGRYLKPLGSGWNIIIFILWLGGLYLLFWIQPEKALLIGAFSIFLIKSFLPFLVSKGYYLDLWVLQLGLIALPLKYIESRGHLVIESFHKLGKEHQQNENRQNI